MPYTVTVVNGQEAPIAFQFEGPNSMRVTGVKKSASRQGVAGPSRRSDMDDDRGRDDDDELFDDEELDDEEPRRPNRPG